MLHQDKCFDAAAAETDTASVLAELEIIYHSYGREKEAEDIHKLVLKIRSKDSIRALRRLRDFYLKNGRTGQAHEIDIVIAEYRTRSSDDEEESSAESG